MGRIMGQEHGIGRLSGAEALGVIYGNVSAEEFHFAVRADTVTKGSFIAVEHDLLGGVLGFICDIERLTDVSFPEARDAFRPGGKEKAVWEGRSANPSPSEVTDAFHLKGEGDLSARVTVFGYRDERGVLRRPSTPLSAGKPVYLADNEFIEDVIGLSGYERSGAHIGTLKGHDLPVNLDINEMIQKHIAVIARTGSGKSYAVGVLIEELLEKDIPVVIIDRHGEYASMVQPNLDPEDLGYMDAFGVRPKGYAPKIIEYSPAPGHGPGAIPLTFESTNLGVDEIIDLASLKVTGSRLGVLHKAVRRLSECMDYYTLRDIAYQAELDKNSAKWNVINAIERLNSYDIFSEQPTPVGEIVKRGRCSVINLKGVQPNVQEVVVARLINTLYRERKEEDIPPFMLVVEEAHNFCPQKGSAVSLDNLINVASEGRKFGFGLCIVTQRPARVDKNVLSQCNTQIILKVTNPNDLKAITSSVEGLTGKAADEIQRLSVGEALVLGANIALPIYVKIRVRKSQHGGKSITVIEEEGDDRAH